MFRILTILMVMLTVCCTRADSVLLWLFDDPVISDFANPEATLHAGDLVGRGDAAGKKVNALRVSATDASGDKYYLAIGDAMSGDAWGDYVILPDMGDPQYGVPESFTAGPGFADFAGLGLSETGLTFAIELGHAEFNGDAISEWVILAAGSDTYENLKKFIIGEEGSMQQTLPWRNAAYSVPEPSSGLLMLVGGALLALRRRRKGAMA